jgi:hypothetical protein
MNWTAKHINAQLAGLPGMRAGTIDLGMAPFQTIQNAMPGSFGMPLGSADTGLTVVDNMVQQTLLLDIVTGAILTSPVLLYGLGIVSTNFRGNFVQTDLGKQISIPYWNTIAAFQDLVNDGDNVQFYQMMSKAETNFVRHAAIGMAVSDWTQFFTTHGAQSQTEFGDQARMRWSEKADSMLVSAAMTKAVAIDNPDFPEDTQARRYLNVYNGSTPRFFNDELYIDGIGARGAIGVNEDPALIIMHNDVLTRSMKVKNAIGDANLIQGGGKATAEQMQVLLGTGAGPTKRMLVPHMVPIAATDSALFKVSDGRYRTMALYPKALAWWQNPAMNFEKRRNIAIPADEIALHMWYIAHCYQRRDMSPRAGVFVWEHNG